MPEYDEQGNEITEVPDLSGDEENSTIRKLRAELKDRDKKLSETTPVAEAGLQAQRELAFLKAGVDLDSPKGKLFAKAYEGELNAEAVKASAIEYEVIEPPKVESTLTPEEIAEAEKAAAATAGAPAGATELEPDPDLAMVEGRKVIEKTGRREEGIATAFRVKLDEEARKGAAGIVTHG